MFRKQNHIVFMIL